MADVLNIQGAFTLAAQTGLTLGSPTVLAQFAQKFAMLRKCEVEYDLQADPAQTVNLNGLTEAAFLYIYCDNPVTARMTTADGSAQAVPVYPLGMWMFPAAKQLTALTLQRVAGQATIVKVVLAQIDQ
jgi:hypothetical protein